MNSKLSTISELVNRTVSRPSWLLDRERRTITAGRCFVLDPVCASPIGHSLNALHYFGQIAERKWPNTTLVASRLLQTTLEEKDKRINRFFDFYYPNFFELDKGRALYELGLKIPDHPLSRAISDMTKFLLINDITGNDALIFPSADYYSLLGLLLALSSSKRSVMPKLFVRFIGVMENAHYDPEGNLMNLVTSIKSYQKQGGFIKISAETEPLAVHLTKAYSFNVTVVPYPIELEILEEPSDKKSFTVLCGGSARPDKGFFRLSNIIDIVQQNSARNETEIKFLVQSFPPKKQFENIGYLNKLYCRNNVTLLEGQLTSVEMIDSYRRSHISLMPYDEATYKLRGSAMLMESIMYGRQCIGQANTGFATQILKYKAGQTASTDQEFASAILSMARLATIEIRNQIIEARKLYVKDVEQSINTWLDGERL